MDVALTILEHLATYSFLTKSQINYLWIVVCDKTYYQIMKRLREPSCRYVQTRKFPPHPKYWALEDMHYLLPRWRKYLIHQQKRQPWNITMPFWASRFTTDYDHRKKTIRIHIVLKRAFDQSGYNIQHYAHYFKGAPIPQTWWRECSTKIAVHDGFLRADSIYLIKNDSKHRLFCVEMHNGYDVIRIIQQLKQYWKALSLGSPSKKYGLSISCVVLVVFEYESTMHTTIERMQQDVFFTHLKPYFLFKTFSKLFTTSLIDWLDGKGELQNLF